MSGRAALEREGYRIIGPAPTIDADFDTQGHLNNAAAVRLFNDGRIAYVRDAVGEWWADHLAEHGYVVVARELHVLYESEGLPGDSFVTAMRYVRREGKALVVEQRLVEARAARAVARAWVVQLLVQDGGVVDWPGRYVARVEEIEGRSLPIHPRSATRWGPPD